MSGCGISGPRKMRGSAGGFREGLPALGKGTQARESLVESLEETLYYDNHPGTVRGETEVKSLSEVMGEREGRNLG